MKRNAGKDVVGTVLCWLLVIALFSLACDAGPDADPIVDPSPTTPNENPVGPGSGTNPDELNYCETVLCWTACNDFDCVDECLDAASPEALAQDVAFDACLESCDYHEDDDDWAGCIVETCPDALDRYDACFEGEEIDYPDPHDDDSLCELYRCLEYTCGGDLSCMGPCEDAANVAALSEYYDYTDCMSGCADAEDYWECIARACPAEDETFSYCIYGDTPIYTCSGHRECNDYCSELNWDCTAECEDTECEWACFDAFEYCQYNCSDLYTESQEILDDLYACLNANCPEAIDDPEAAYACSVAHCNDALNACLAD